MVETLSFTSTSKHNLLCHLARNTASSAVLCGHRSVLRSSAIESKLPRSRTTNLLPCCCQTSELHRSVLKLLSRLLCLSFMPCTEILYSVRYRSIRFQSVTFTNDAFHLILLCFTGENRPAKTQLRAHQAAREREVTAVILALYQALVGRCHPVRSTSASNHIFNSALFYCRLCRAFHKLLVAQHAVFVIASMMVE